MQVIKKLTSVLLLAAFLHVNAHAHAQTITLSERNAPLEKVFRSITRQTGYNFFYSDELMLLAKKVTVEVKNAPLAQVLDMCFANQPFTYQVLDKLIVVKKRDEEKAVSAPLPVINIKGRVTNEKGEPVVGATVSVKGGKLSTATNENGEFQLRNVDENAVLVITSVSTETIEMRVNGNEEISVSVKTHTSELGSVQVLSTGYQTLPKGRATGSFHVLDGSEMNRVASTDYRQRLEGLVPGVLSGRGNSLVIRGQGTFSANQAPLVVVDGVPVEGADYKVNPDDIEQITVLKDAASASIWGVRSANGVIVITTKRGNRSGKTSVTYSNFISLEEKADLSDLRQLRADKYAKGEWNKYLAFGTGFLQPYSFVTEIGKIYNDYKKDNDLSRAEKRIDSLGSFNNTDQLEDIFYRSALVNNHTIAVKTGDQRISHYLSVNYVHDRMFQQGNDLNKINFISNSDFGISKKIKLQFGTRGTYYKSNLNAEPIGSLKPYTRILDDQGNYLNEDFGVAQDYKMLLQSKGWKTWSYNRYQEMQNNDRTLQSVAYAANMRFTFEPVRGLKYLLQTNYEKTHQTDRNLRNENSYYTRDLVNKFTENTNLLNPAIGKYHLPKNGGILAENNFESNAVNLRNQLEYTKQFSQITLNVLGGHELYSYSSRGNYNIHFGYNPQTLVQIDVNRKDLQTGVTGYNAVQNGSTFLQAFASLNEQIERYVSYYSTASLSYKNKYDVFGSARLDKTNLLVNADKYRNNPSWSAGAKWSISNEEFFKASFVNTLALKLAYGVSGNIDKSTAPDMIASSLVSSMGLPILVVTNPENKELGWEKTYILNIGTEFSMFENRLSGTLEYYYKNGTDLLYNVTIDPTLGWGNIRKNAASMANKGVDLYLNAKAIARKDFEWNVGFNFSYNYNRVKKVDYTPTQTDILGAGNPVVGQPLNYLAVIPYIGIDKAGNPMIRTTNGKDTLAYSKLKDFTNADYIYAGRKDPKFFGSMIQSFRYRNWRLEAFFTYKLGHKFLVPGYQTSIGSGPVNEWSDPELTWRAPGDENTKPYPKLVNGSYPTDLEYVITHNERMVDKADIVRLKMLSLEYNLSNLIRTSLVKESSIRVSAENLWYWSANRYDLDTDYVIPSTHSGSSAIVLPARTKYVVYLKFTF